jgi:hypothetical protein
MTQVEKLKLAEFRGKNVYVLKRLQPLVYLGYFTLNFAIIIPENLGPCVIKAFDLVARLICTRKIDLKGTL